MQYKGINDFQWVNFVFQIVLKKKNYLENNKIFFKMVIKNKVFGHRKSTCVVRGIGVKG